MHSLKLSFLLAASLLATNLCADPLVATSSETVAKSRASRSAAAKAILQDIERFASLVQSPSPSDLAWLDSEQAAIARITNSEDQLARRLQLLRAPELHQAKLHRQLQEVRNAVLCVLDPSVSAQRELHCWTVAAFLLDDNFVFEDGLKNLLRARRLPADIARRVGAGTDDGIQLRYRMVSRNIYEYIVIPLLRGDAE